MNELELLEKIENRLSAKYLLFEWKKHGFILFLFVIVVVLLGNHWIVKSVTDRVAGNAKDKIEFAVKKAELAASTIEQKAKGNHIDWEAHFRESRKGAHKQNNEGFVFQPKNEFQRFVEVEEPAHGFGIATVKSEQTMSTLLVQFSKEKNSVAKFEYEVLLGDKELPLEILTSKNALKAKCNGNSRVDVRITYFYSGDYVSVLDQREFRMW